MSRLRPIIAYLAGAVFFFWVLLAIVTLPNSSRWFKSQGFLIKKDIVLFKSADISQQTSIDNAITVKSGQKIFNSGVFSIDNTPSVPKQGLYGVLYDLGESCNKNKLELIPKTPFLSLHENINKIALIKQGDSCFLTEKILNAETDGAVGAVVYLNDINSNNSLYSNNQPLNVMPDSVHIPAYYVDYQAGVLLLKNIRNLYNARNESIEGYSEPMVRLKLVPNSRPVLDHWQFALIVIGFMLIVIVIVITGLQLRAWRLAKARRREREMVIASRIILSEDEQRQLAMNDDFWRDPTNRQPPGPMKQKLTQELVNILPTYEYSTKQSKWESEEKSDRPEAPTESYISSDEPSRCVICLDAFADGDVIRQLQCNHEYHRDCIDVWLTKKSSSCPLCLSWVQIPTVPENIHVPNNYHIQPFSYNVTPSQNPSNN